MNKKFICTLLTALIALGMFLTGCNSSENADTVKAVLTHQKLRTTLLFTPKPKKLNIKF